MGVDNSIFPNSQEAVEQQYQGFLKMQHMTEDMLPKEMIPLVKGMFTEKPFIEGPWMDKYNGKYYLQYACPGAELQCLCRRSLCFRVTTWTIYTGRE